jgi:hypothetical protein
MAERISSTMANQDVQAPIFLFDSREIFHPIAVESVPAVPAKLVKVDRSDGGVVNLDALPADGGWMDFPPHPDQQEERLRGQFGNVGYHRVKGGGGLQWHQYWLWYLYNPKKYFVTGEHEGDWEFVQIGYAGKTPICMTCSQHHSGGARMWWDVDKEGGRARVYVALGSHANYFQPVNQIPEIGDDGDGGGARLDAIEWRDFGTWSTWPGRWGHSTGEGQSPESPGCQGDRWNAPQKYHSRAALGH